MISKLKDGEGQCLGYSCKDWKLVVCHNNNIGGGSLRIFL